MKILVSLFALIIITASCNSLKEPMDVKTENSDTPSGTYIISQMGENDSISEALSITFEDSTNRVSGFAGCNSFFGTYSIENNTITFKDIASTKKYCQKDLNDLENQFMAVLKRSKTFSINKKILSFLENETILMTAIKQDSVKEN